MNKKREIDIIEEHLPYIRKICASFSRDTDELNDLVQEVFIQLWKNFNTFKGDAKLTTWIYRITVNMCLYQIGKSRKLNLIRTDQPMLVKAAEASHNQDEEENLSLMLYEAIKLLKPIDRAIITLYLERKAQDEIGEIMGLSVTNVGVRINRAKKELKKLVYEKYGRDLE